MQEQANPVWQKELARIQIMAKRTLMVMDVPHMQRTRIGVDFMTALPLNPKRCAVAVEVEIQFAGVAMGPKVVAAIHVPKLKKLTTQRAGHTVPSPNVLQGNRRF